MAYLDYLKSANIIKDNIQDTSRIKLQEYINKILQFLSDNKCKYLISYVSGITCERPTEDNGCYKFTGKFNNDPVEIVLTERSIPGDINDGMTMDIIRLYDYIKDCRYNIDTARCTKTLEPGKDVIFPELRVFVTSVNKVYIEFNFVEM